MNNWRTKTEKPSAAAAVTNDGELRKETSWAKSMFLGKGAFGSVYLATNKNQNARAIKSAKLSKASSLMGEGRILKRLQSPFVVGYYGDEIAREGTEDRYNLILEYCSGISIAGMIKHTHGGLSEFDVKLFTRDVLCGLRYIHSRNIIHCDIKPDNLLLCPVDLRERASGYLTKIGDFGLAMEKGSVGYRNGRGHRRGTRRYMAPELLAHGILDFGVDVWALGCSVLEMLTGKRVWGEHGVQDPNVLVYIIGRSDLIPHIPSCVSAYAEDFLKRCLVKDPALRWPISALMNHPFVR